MKKFGDFAITVINLIITLCFGLFLIFYAALATILMGLFIASPIIILVLLVLWLR